jgi:RelB Antitoxin alpha helical domain
MDFTQTVEDYPFVEKFLTDKSGQVRKVVLQLEDYLRLLEAFGSEGLYQAMKKVKHETPLGLNTELQVLNADHTT